MKTIEEIRLENLTELRRGFPSERQFAIRLNKAPNQVNQWFGKGAARVIQSDSAREIEEIMGKPRGWLDNDHAATAPSQLRRPTAETILAAVRLASGASTGVGLNTFEIETEEDAELFSLAIEEVLDDGITVASDSDVQRFARKLQSRTGVKNGKIGTAGSDGGVDRAAGKTKAGDAAGSTPGRKRKQVAG